jgi:PKD repeat protein
LPRPYWLVQDPSAFAEQTQPANLGLVRAGLAPAPPVISRYFLETPPASYAYLGPQKLPPEQMAEAAFNGLHMKFTLLLSLLLITATAFGQTRRYVETIAGSSTITSNVIYGQAPGLNGLGTNETDTSLEDLVMDIYSPTGDTHNQRAAIIFAHSGGFFNGSRGHDDIVALCDSFARKGYVTATIDYRKGFWPLSDAELHGTRAVYRGIQDGRTAVRYLRANAAALGIDTNYVYLAGSSAGGFIALHSIYMTEIGEVPPETGEVDYFDFFTTRTTPDLGPPDAGSNPGFSGTPNGVINLWGAVAAIDLVDATDDQPIYLAHGTADGTVPFITGPPFGFTGFPDVFGSSLISDQLAANGATNYETYFVPGGEHEFYGADNGTWSNGVGPNVYWDTLLPRITQFLWRQHKPTADFTADVTALSVDFTNTSFGDIDWFWNFGDGNTSTGENPTHSYAATGTYSVELFVRNNIHSWDTLEQEIAVEAILPLTWTGPLQAVHDGKDTWLDWSVANQTGTDHFVVEHALEGRPFLDLGRMAAAGNEAETIDYRFRHPSPEAGTHLYRVRQVDLDGRSTLSSLATVEVGAQFGAYPNPTTGKLTLTGLEVEVRRVEVFDGAGRRLSVVSILANGSIDLSGLRRGHYWLRPLNSVQWIGVQIK